MKLLVIEDSERLLFSLGQALRKSGHSVDLVNDGLEGYDYARFNDYDVIVLDIMLPGMDGLTILKKLREIGKQTHVLILSAVDQVADRVKGLELGADDYMIKPFSFDELNARIQTLVRRKFELKSPILTWGSLQLNTASRSVTVESEAIALTSGELSILEYLLLNRGRILSKEQLFEKMHDSDSDANLSVVEVIICKLRNKLSALGPGFIKTRRGLGYIIEMEEPN